MPPAILEASYLSHQIASRWLWQDLSFSIAAGDRVALVGPSGAGKTILLRTLAALEPLQQGGICFGGRPLSDWEIPHYRARVMYLPQTPHITRQLCRRCHPSSLQATGALPQVLQAFGTCQPAEGSRARPIIIFKPTNPIFVRRRTANRHLLAGTRA